VKEFFKRKHNRPRKDRVQKGLSATSDQTEHYRLFFGVFLTLELQAALNQAQQRLVGAGWKKTPEDQFHVTLLFMASVPNNKLEELKKTAREVAKTIPAFVANVRGTGFFPNEGSPRVWFAKIEGEGFAPLAQLLQQHLAAHSNTDFEFQPHITLARKKGPAQRPGPLTFNESFTVSRFALMRSILGQGGAEYQTLAQFQLG
jgi:RNA 2',3'-cyclic 3'-phosphodiesterase